MAEDVRAEDALAKAIVMDTEVIGCGGSNPPMAEAAQDTKDAEVAGCGDSNPPMAEDAQGNDTVMTMDLAGCSDRSPPEVERDSKTDSPRDKVDRKVEVNAASSIGLADKTDMFRAQVRWERAVCFDMFF